MAQDGEGEKGADDGEDPREAALWQSHHHVDDESMHAQLISSVAMTKARIVMLFKGGSWWCLVVTSFRVSPSPVQSLG